MGDSVFQDIIDGLKSGYETITDANDYKIEVKHVDNQFKAPDELAEPQLPAILVVPSTIVFEELTGFYAEGDFPINVFGYVMDNVSPVNKMLTLLEAVIKYHVSVKNRIGDTESYVRVRQIEMSANVFDIFGLLGGVQDPFAAFRIDLEAHYNTDLTSIG